jgi:general secretion pathway protein A
MYLTFYNLKKEPFHITPDPEFLYLSPSHKEALAAIIYGIEQKKGFVAIVGDVGVGKTTILRSYLDTTDRSHLKVIYVFNARLTFEGLLKTIYEELGLPIETNDTMQMVNNLYRVLIEEYRQGNTMVLVIDEAQNMPLETLENLRMLSNLETSKDKLIQIVLVGQLEFEEELNLRRLRQLKQRIAIRSTISPLTKTESLDYIKYRLQKAGSDHGSVFTDAALRTIASKAKGIPRAINILCDNALITGFGYQQKPATAKVVREVVADFQGAKPRFIFKWWYACLVLVAAAGIFFFLNGGSVRDRVGVTRQPGKVQSLSDGPIASERENINISEAERAADSPGVFSEISQKRESSSAISPKAGTVGNEAGESRMGLSPKTRVIRKGDTLAGIIEEEYGWADEELIEAVKRKNPQIVNPDLILPGNKIILPEAFEGRGDQ